MKTSDPFHFHIFQHSVFKFCEKLPFLVLFPIQKWKLKLLKSTFCLIREIWRHCERFGQGTLIWELLKTFSSISCIKNQIFMWIFFPSIEIFSWISIFQNPGEASSRSRIFLISLVYLCMYCLFVYLFVSRLLVTLTTIQTWNLAHILPLTLSKNGFFVFSIKSPWRPLASKNCRVT